MSCESVCVELVRYREFSNVEECVKHCRKGLRQLIGTDNEEELYKKVFEVVKKSMYYKVRARGSMYNFRHVLMLVTVLAAGERAASELMFNMRVHAAAVNLAALGFIRCGEQRCKYGECTRRVVYSLP